MKYWIHLLIVSCIVSISSLHAQELSVVTIPQAETENSFLLDGARSASFWAYSKELPALRNADSKHIDSQCSIEMLDNREWLILGIDIQEPKNIVATEYMNNKPLWFDDNIAFTFFAKDKITVNTNPLGVITVSVNDSISKNLLQKDHIRICARISEKKWRAEIAIHKSLFNDNLNALKCTIEKQRQQRGYDGFYSSQAEFTLQLPPFSQITQELVVLPRQTFANKTLFSAVYQEKLPQTQQDWEAIPYQELTLNTGDNLSDLNFQPSRVRLAATENEVMIQIENFEEQMQSLTQDKELAANDSNEIFIAPEGYQYIETTISFDESVSCHIGLTGGRRVKSMAVPNWIKTKVEKQEKKWITYFHIQNKDLLNFAGSPLSHTPSRYAWSLQIVRNRAKRTKENQNLQESQLALTNSATAHCPARFAIIIFSKDHKQAFSASKPTLEAVFTKAESVELQITNSLNFWWQDRVAAFRKQGQTKREAIQDKAHWELYKKDISQKVIQAIFPNEGLLPKAEKTKSVEIYTSETNAEIQEKEIIIKGLMFKSRKEVPVSATLYLPLDYKLRKNMPAMILIPSHHTPRNTGDLYYAAKNLALGGCLAIAIDTLGSGERGIAPRWNHKNHQRNLIGTQLVLANEEILGWTIADVLSTVDYLYERGDIDKKKIGIIGGVAGGGDVVALAGALDERISITIPFNFSSDSPISGWYDLTRSYPKSHLNEITPWSICALIAPRQMIMAHEFAWTDDKKTELEKFQRIYAFYEADKNIQFVHGGPNTHASSFLGLHRVQIYKILNKWWGLHLPEKVEDEKKPTLKDGVLEATTYQTARDFITQNFSRKASEKDRISAYTEPNFLAKHIAIKVRKRYLTSIKKNIGMANILSDTLTNIVPFKKSQYQKETVATNPYIQEKFKITLEPQNQNGTTLMTGLWLFTPTEKATSYPLVLCLAQEGKTIFFEKRESEIKQFLQQGYAVALADVRGTGETETSNFRLPESSSASLAYGLWQANESLIARRLCDVQTILEVLTKQPNIQKDNLILWGEGFSKPNGKENDLFKFEETGFRQADVEGKRLAEPLGAILAMLTPHFLPSDIRVAKVIAGSGLISYESVLNDFYYYLPADVIIPRILTRTDLPEIGEALIQKSIQFYCENMRDAKNRVVSEATFKKLYPHATFYSEQHIPNLVKQVLEK